MTTKSELYIQEPDFAYLKEPEKQLEKRQPNLPKRLPHQGLIEVRSPNTRELQTEGGQNFGKETGVLDLMNLLENFDYMEESIREILGDRADQTVLELVELAGLDNKEGSTDTRFITVEETAKHPPETVEQAINTYTKWLDEKNRLFEMRNKNKRLEDRVIAMQNWAAVRTIAKNRYLETLAKVWENNPDRLKDAIAEIQLNSATQLLVEADIVSQIKKTRRFNPGEDILKPSKKASSMGTLTEAMLARQDYKCQSLHAIGEKLPQLPEYISAFEVIESGVKGEVVGISYLMEELEKLDLEGVKNIRIRHANQEEDINGADVVITADVEGETVVILVDIKTAALSESLLIEPQEGQARILAQANASPQAWQIPAGLLQAVKQQSFENVRGNIRGLSVRLGPKIVNGNADTADEYLRNKTRQNLRQAFRSEVYGTFA